MADEQKRREGRKAAGRKKGEREDLQLRRNSVWFKFQERLDFKIGEGAQT